MGNRKLSDVYFTKLDRCQVFQYVSRIGSTLGVRPILWILSIVNCALCLAAMYSIWWWLNIGKSKIIWNEKHSNTNNLYRDTKKQQQRKTWLRHIMNYSNAQEILPIDIVKYLKHYRNVTATSAVDVASVSWCWDDTILQ